MGDLQTFGAAIDGAEVEAGLIAFLERWMPTYLGWAKRLKDPTDTIWQPEPGNPDPAQAAWGFASIASYQVVHQANDKWPEDQLPMFLIYSRGLGEPPRMQGDGTVSGRFLVIVTAIAEGIDAADSKALARLYATAARVAMTQHPDLDDLAAPPADDEGEGGLELVSHENYQIRRGVEADRDLMGVSDGYLIDVPAILNANGGVPDPLEDPTVPPDDPPTVQTHQVDVDADEGDVVGSLRRSGFFPDE